MGQTTLRGTRIEDGTVKRADLDVVTPGEAVIRKILAGTNVTISYTGADSGTGDVTINVAGGSGSPGGATTLLQYNNGGAFGGITNVKSDGTNILRVSDDSPVVFDEDVRGDAASLSARLNVISNFTSPNAGGLVTGLFYDNNPHAAVGTLAGIANRFDLAPFYSSHTMSIDQIGCAVSTAVAASLFKVVIYGADANGWPGALLYETGNISGATVGYAFEAITFTFQSATLYWIGVRHSSTCTLRAIALGGAWNLGLATGAATSQGSVLRRTLTFANAAPNPYNFVSTDITAGVNPTSIRFRKA